MQLISILTTLLGVVIGFLSLSLTKRLITNRVGLDFKFHLTNSKYAFLIWSIAYGSAFKMIEFYFKQDMVQFIEALMIFSILASISIVDLLIRKIPNSMLLSLIIIHSSFVIYNGNWSNLLTSLSALVIGFSVFLLPSFFGLSIGGGDIKLAAVVAYCVGIQGFIIAMISMVISLLFYIFYLFATKRGNLKSMSALGPFLAIGCLVAFIYHPTVTI